MALRHEIKLYLNLKLKNPIAARSVMMCLLEINIAYDLLKQMKKIKCKQNLRN